VKEKKLWKWLLQTFLPVGLFVAYSALDNAPFSSEHPVAKIAILIVIYLVFHLYVDFVRDGKL